MAISDTVTNVMDKVRGLLRREPKAMDAFGGDDLFDGDGDGEAKSNLGPKIAMAVSGVMFLALASLVITVVMTGDDAAVTGGSLNDIEVVEEVDPTAATDRSAERRPWLTPTDNTAAAPRRLGLSEDAKPGDTKTAAAKPTATPPVAAPAKAPEPAKVEAPKPAAPAPAAPTQAAAAAPPAATTPATPPASTAVAAKTGPAKAVTPAPAAPTPATPTPVATSATPAPAQQVAAAPTKAEPAKPEPVKAEPVKTEPAKVPDAPADPSTTLADMKAADEPEEVEQAEAAMPSLMAPALTAPGAPRRFDVATGEAPTGTAGGRPRLNDPKLPPTDRATVGAPPPRFSAISEIKLQPATTPTTGKLAIIVEGLGLNRAATEAALTKLPPTVTLAFSPYARDLKRLMDRAKAKGHEVLIEVPMEGKNFPAEDPGPLGLLTGLEAKDNSERLETILKEASGATGVFDGMGSKFRESPTHIGEVLTKLKSMNLFYVQGRPGVRVGETEVPSATTDVVIDERPFRAAVDARFDYAEKLAKHQGSAVAVMSARPISFERLALWVDQLPKKGVSLSPVSQVLVQ